MSIQDIVVGVVVASAVAYLVWKLAFKNRAPRRKRIDVPTKQLLRKKTDRSGGKKGCH